MAPLLSRKAGVLAGLVLALALLAVAILNPRAPRVQAGGKPSVPVAVHSDITFRVSFAGGGERESVEATGTADFNTEGDDLSFRMRLTAEGETVEVIAVGGKIYTREGGGPWEVEDVPASAGQPFGGFGPAAGDQESLAAALAQLSSAMQQLPDETIRGVPMHHTRIELGKEQLLGLIALFGPALGGEAAGPEDLQDLADLFREFRLTADIWEGADDGFPYRFTFRLDAAADVFGETLEISFDMTFDNLPLPERVPITAPL